MIKKKIFDFIGHDILSKLSWRILHFGFAHTKKYQDIRPHPWQWRMFMSVTDFGIIIAKMGLWFLDRGTDG